MITATQPSAPPAGEPSRRTFSGKAFVVACALAAAAFVGVLVFVSPVLLARTQAAAPPPAPQEVAAGEIAGRSWSATALEPEPEEPCLAVEVGSVEQARACADVRGSSLRAIDSVEIGGSSLLYGIVDPRTARVRVELSGGAPLELEPAYVDFGFPLGFFAAPLPPDARPSAVEALDRDGEQRDRAACSPEGAASTCTSAQNGGQG